MLNRSILTVLASMVLLLAGAASATAAPDRPPTPPPTDFWQKMGFMNMAHQGGERENPGNTLYAFKKAVRHDGADVIDLDTTLTEDGVLVATHDEEPCHTSNAPCGAEFRFRNQTLEELRAYDFAYWFSPGLATYYDKSLDVPHPYRGIATGDPAPPDGYNASDFRIATFAEVLTAFPDTPINVELKPYAGVEATAQAAADVLAANSGREKDVIINAFSQEMLEKFHELAPNHLALGGSSDGTLAYVQGEPIEPTPVAVQPPDKFNLPPVVDTLPILRPFFEYDGFISVVWPSDYDDAQETAPWYEKLISQGADAINTMFPARLHEYLCENGIPRPDGSLRCPDQQCPVGFTGYAPNCEKIPVCPEGTEGTPPDDCQKICPVGSVLVGDECECPPGQVGTPPNCEPHGDPKTVVTKVRLAPKKRKAPAGKQVKLRIKIRARVGLAPKQFRIRLRSSNRRVKVPKSVVIRLRAPAGRAVTASKMIRVRIKRNARGKARITARIGKLSARSTLTIKRAVRKKKKRKRGGIRSAGGLRPRG